MNEFGCKSRSHAELLKQAVLHRLKIIAAIMQKALARSDISQIVMQNEKKEFHQFLKLKQQLIMQNLIDFNQHFLQNCSSLIQDQCEMEVADDGGISIEGDD